MPSQTFTTDGTFQVPDGVTSLTVELYGETGADTVDGVGVPSAGGRPGHVAGTLSVTPLQTLTLNFVAGGAGGGGGITGGVSGGDGADIRQGGTALSDRVAVAAGGGGAAPRADGGAGGADVGEDGEDSTSGGGLGGAGATQSTGNPSGEGRDGLAGATQGGGGGGGGYFGGGGGGGSDNGNGGGGGGGGSNYDDGLDTVSANLRGDTSSNRREITLQYAEPAPANLSATPTAENEVTVSWTSPFVDADGFNVYRAESSGSAISDYTRIASPAASTTYVDTNVQDGEEYYYRVTATDSDGFGESLLSPEDNAVTPFPAPQNVTALMSVDGSELTISWTVVDDSPDGKINVYRSTDGSLGSSVASLGDDATLYVDSNVSSGTTYHYTIRRSTPDATADSAQVSRDPGEDAPQNLSVDSAGPLSVSLSWTDVTSDETEFDVRRREVFDNGTKSSFQTVANALPPGSETHTDNSVSPSRTYEYQVRVTDT